jgi:hypothetical protein
MLHPGQAIDHSLEEPEPVWRKLMNVDSSIYGNAPSDNHTPECFVMNCCCKEKDELQ